MPVSSNMKKNVRGKKLGRSRTARNALFRSQIAALAEYGKINTTYAKAKAIQPTIDNFCRLAKGDQASKRKLLAKLGNDKKTTDNISEHIGNIKRNSGFTRIIPLPARKGDNAKMARLEWVDQEVKSEKSKGNNKSNKKNAKSKKSAKSKK